MRVSRSRAVFACTAVVLTLTFAACTQQPADEGGASNTAGSAEMTPEEQIARGERLIIGGGCHDCHTPKMLTPAGPEADLSLMLSGHPESQTISMPAPQDPKSPWSVHINDHLTAWSGAWGVSFAANLTPDENTGIGIWTEEMFVTALQQGKHMGKGRPILPPMPWNWYGKLPEEDLKAMFAYLKSIPAIANRVPVPLGPDGRPIEEP